MAQIIDEEEKRVIGHYWTDRESAGEIELSNRRGEKFQTFQSAAAYYAISLLRDGTGHI